MAKKNLKKIIEDAQGIAGFGAVQKYGYELTNSEIKKIADYAEALGGSREHVTSVLKRAGRPFSMADSSFKRRCLLCKTLNNYCCC